jgi:prepilin-type N-terminal cleavage/methylation domain-containing protein
MDGRDGIDNQKQQGFTLVEVVVALGIGSVVLISAMSMLVFFMQAWRTEPTPYERFCDHVSQCMRFLQQEADTFSVVADKDNVGTTFLTTVKLPKENVKTLGALKNTPMPFTQGASSQPCWETLQVNSSGLFLVREEPEIAAKRLTEGVEATGKTKMQRLLVSPYVIKTEYGFFDPQSGKWQFVQNLDDYERRLMNNSGKKGKKTWVRPDVVRLTFRKDDFLETRCLYLNNTYVTEMTEASGKSSTDKKDSDKKKSDKKDDEEDKGGSKKEPKSSGGKKSKKKGRR